MKTAIKPAGREAQMRARLAQEAARVMIEDGITDFAAAKRKAAEHLGVTHTKNLPRNTEIEQARQQYQRLFLGDQQQQHQQQLLSAAVRAMELLSEFKPLLTGQLLSGIAAPHAAVELHLFADAPEQVAQFLHRHNIPADQSQTHLRYNRDTSVEIPVYSFMAGDTAIELTVFPPEGRRQPPLSRIDGQAMQRLRIDEVEAFQHAGIPG